MARRVFIFGAGASASMGTPVLREFLDRAYSLLQSVSTPRIVKQDLITKDAFELVFEVVNRRLPLLHASVAYDSADLEQVFNLIEMGRLLERFPLTSADELPKLGSAIRTVLAETIERTTLFPYDNSGKQYAAPSDYGRLVGECMRGETEAGDYAFITFNYDLGLEMAFHLYKVRPDYCLAPGQRGDTPLLKLHGSLNWARCSSCNEIVEASMESLIAAPRNGSAADNSPGNTKTLEVTKELGRGHACGSAPSKWEPLIVPPGWNKSQYYPIFQRVWARAAKELSEAEDICVVGYSFPPADTFFHALLGLSLAAGARLRTFLVVDPNPEVRQRFRDILGPQNASRFEQNAGQFSNFLNSGALAERFRDR